MKPELSLAPRRLDEKRKNDALLLWIFGRGGQSLSYVFGKAHFVGFLSLPDPANDVRMSVSATMFFRL